MRHFSIAFLMTVILVCGVALAALRDASEMWAGILLLLTIFLLAWSLVAIPYRQEGKRAFWFGFAVFGWGCTGLTFAPWFMDEFRPKLPTTHLLTFLHEKIKPQQGDYEVAFSPDGDVISSIRRGSLMVTRLHHNTRWGLLRLVTANDSQFQSIGHCLFALLFALTGGIAGKWLQKTSVLSSKPG